MGKGEIAGYQHSLLFPQCFQKTSFQGHEKSGLCGKKLTLAKFKLLMITDFTCQMALDGVHVLKYCTFPTFSSTSV